MKLKRCTICNKETGDLQLFRGSSGSQKCSYCLQRTEYDLKQRPIVPLKDWR